MGTQPLPLTPTQVNYAQPEQFRQIVRQELTDARVATPAFLAEDMDPTTQTVTVQVALQERVRTTSGPQWWDVPPIIKVPICIPRGGGFSCTFPLKKGNPGLLVFCDTCFDLWWQNGTANAPVAQNTGVASGSQRQFEVRRHHVHDCGFIPGMYSQKDLLANYSTDSLQIRSDDGISIIDVSETAINITAPAAAVNVTGEAQINAATVALAATSAISITAPSATMAASGGTAQALMTDTFFQWFQTNVYPFLVAHGYTGPTIPSGSETSVLKGQ